MKGRAGQGRAGQGRAGQQLDHNCLHGVYQSTLDEVINITGSEGGFFAEHSPPHYNTPASLTVVAITSSDPVVLDCGVKVQLPISLGDDFKNLALFNDDYAPIILKNQLLDTVDFGLLNWSAPKQAMAIPLLEQQTYYGIVFVVNPKQAYSVMLAKRLWPLLAACSRVRQTVGNHSRRMPQDLLTPVSGGLENKLKQLDDLSFDAIIEINDNHRIIRFNSSAEKMFGLEAKEALGQHISDLIPERFPNEHHIHNFPVLEAYETFHQPQKSLHAQNCDGHLFPIELRSSSYKFNGRSYFTLIIHDKSELENYKREEEDQIQRFKAVSDLAPIGILQTNMLWECVYVNDRWCEICRLNKSTVFGMGWINSIFKEDVVKMLETLRQAMLEERELDIECRFQTPMGEVVWVELRARPLFNFNGEMEGFLSTISDVTYRHITEEKLRNMAERDSLTGLANRALFQDRLGHAIDRLARHDSLILLCLDLDGFKTINDSLGHDAGDKLLVEVAKRLKSCVRVEDTVARVGGDEFLILLEGVKHSSVASDLALKILESFKPPVRLGMQEIYITTSIGITFASKEDKVDNQTLMKQADIALYRAKSAGRNNFQYYSPEMEAESQDRLYLGNCLHRALEREEFQVHFQLQARVKDNTVFGSEALMRWQHPERGLLAAGDFIPLLEESGLIVPVSCWLIDEALKSHKQLLTQKLMPPDGHVSINLAPRQLREAGVVDVFKTAIEKHQLDGENVVVEITESVLMDQSHETSKNLQSLKSLGIRIAMDDFGTGYSSLTYLKRFPIDFIKIDKSFIQDILTDKEDEAITKAVIALADSLDLTVVAEGVDCQQKLTLLKLWGCHSYQGFLLNRPASFAQLQSTLTLSENNTDII